MQRAVLEDNSLEFKEEAETGQYLLSGLGELHL
jgi:translation elongation factor EF-G